MNEDYQKIVDTALPKEAIKEVLSISSCMAPTLPARLLLDNIQEYAGNTLEGSVDSLEMCPS